MEVSLTKKTDKRKKQYGAPKCHSTPSDANLYLSTSYTSELVKSNQSDRYIKQLFLEYRALLLSDVYMKYCYYQLKKSPQKINDYEKSHPNINDVYSYWGNLYSEDGLQATKSFHGWASRHWLKVNGVSSHEVSVNANVDCLVQVSISSIAFTGTELDSFYEDVADAVNNKLLLRKQKGASIKVLNKTECMLDIIYLKKYYNLNASQCVVAGIASEKECWLWYKSEYQNYNKSSSFSKGLAGAIALFTEKADLVIEQTLNNNFPRSSSSK